MRKLYDLYNASSPQVVNERERRTAENLLGKGLLSGFRKGFPPAKIAPANKNSGDAKRF